jgi:hypothetical protein
VRRAWSYAQKTMEEIPEQCCSTLHECQKENIYFTQRFASILCINIGTLFSIYFIGSSLITRRRVNRKISKIFLVEACTCFAASE